MIVLRLESNRLRKPNVQFYAEGKRVEMNVMSYKLLEIEFYIFIRI